MKNKRKSLWLTLLIWGVIFLFSATIMPVRGVAHGAENRQRMAGYTTYYDEKAGGRSENIRLAASLIDGVTVQAYGSFSFNQTVGERTKERGFQAANVIVKGEYVQGLGGGVCQVSTTLYNAVLCAGLEVVEYHPHSLAVGYVPPSQDAMVSSCHDFSFFNPYDFPVRVEMTTGEGAIRARIYGKKTGERREIVSRVTGRTPPPAPKIVEGEREEILRAEKWGVKSESYLEIYQNGVLLGRKLLRKDAYLPTQGIIAKKTTLLDGNFCAKGCFFPSRYAIMG